MSEFEKKFREAVGAGCLEHGKRESDVQYAQFSELLDQAKSILIERKVSVVWTGAVGSNCFALDTPVGVISAKRLAFLDKEQVGAAIVFYCEEEHDGKVHDLCVLRLTSYGPWLLSGGARIVEVNGQHLPATAVSVVTAALAAKLEHDHERVMAS